MKPKDKDNKISTSDEIQILAEKFVYEDDDSVFFDFVKLMENGLKKYIIDLLVEKCVPRAYSFSEEIYDKTIDNIYDTARDYYDNSKGKFLTWVYFVARRNCINTIRPYISSKFYLVSGDVSDIERNDMDEPSPYKISIPDNEKLYYYEIDGVERESNYSQLMGDVIACIHSCIYSLDDINEKDKRDKSVLTKLYVDGLTMQETSDILGVKLTTVKNIANLKRIDILKKFYDKYQNIYDLLMEERIFLVDKLKENAA